MKNDKIKIILTVIFLFISFFYAILRYNIFGGIEWSHLPLFVFNKAIALSAVIFLGISIIMSTLARIWPKSFSHLPDARKYFGILGFVLLVLHSVMSVIILKPVYFENIFFENDSFNLIGEFSLLFGVLALTVYTLMAITSIQVLTQSVDEQLWKRIHKCGYLGYTFIFLHVAIMKFEGWLKPSDWPAGLIPMSLIAVLFILFILLFRFTDKILFKN